MANLTNIFISIYSFYTETSSLLREMEMHFYHSFFISSETFDESRFENFYDDEFCVHAIEGLGGRYTKEELEMLSLRIISKTPDKKVKLFIEKLVKSLKKNGEYGLGVGPGESPLYNRIFYKKLDVQGRALWFDFARKGSPASIR